MEEVKKNDKKTAAVENQKKTSCPKCGGEMKEASFEILNSLSLDFGHDLVIGPKKLFYLSGIRRSGLRVMACMDCGYIETYAIHCEGL